MDADAPHSKLVRNILEERKQEGREAEHAGASAEVERGNRSASGLRLGRIGTGRSKRSGGQASVSVPALRDSLQQICRSALPLSKSMVRTRLPSPAQVAAGRRTPSQDYVSHDMDTMERELEAWQSEHRSLTEVRAPQRMAMQWGVPTPPSPPNHAGLRAQKLEDAQRETERQLQPLKMQLTEAEEQLAEQEVKVQATRSKIAKNEARIQELLSMVVQAPAS